PGGHLRWGSDDRARLHARRSAESLSDRAAVPSASGRVRRGQALRAWRRRDVGGLDLALHGGDRDEARRWGESVDAGRGTGAGREGRPAGTAGAGGQSGEGLAAPDAGGVAALMATSYWQFTFSTQTTEPPTGNQIRFDAGGDYTSVSTVWV